MQASPLQRIRTDAPQQREARSTGFNSNQQRELLQLEGKKAIIRRPSQQQQKGFFVNTENTRDQHPSVPYPRPLIAPVVDRAPDLARCSVKKALPHKLPYARRFLFCDTENAGLFEVHTRLPGYDSRWRWEKVSREFRQRLSKVIVAFEGNKIIFSESGSVEYLLFMTYLWNKLVVRLWNMTMKRWTLILIIHVVVDRRGTMYVWKRLMRLMKTFLVSNAY